MTVAVLPEIIVPDRSFRKTVQELSGEKVVSCYQCEKCTNGCPVTFAMDIVPHKLIRLVNLGVDQVLSSDTIWVCASCETCTTRCPNNIDIAHIMDTLRQISRLDGIPSSQKNAPIFHSVFLSNVKRLGRMHEMSMATIFTLKSEGVGGLLKQAGMGLQMMRKGKFSLLPGRFRANKQVRNIFKKFEGRAEK